MLLISHQKIEPDLKKSFCEIFSLTITDQGERIPPNSPYFVFSENTLSLHLNKKIDSSEEKKPSMASTPPPLSFDFIDTWKKIKPGFKRKIFFKRLPKILITKDTYKMGFGLMKKTSEKGIIRLVKVAAGVEQ